MHLCCLGFIARDSEQPHCRSGGRHPDLGEHGRDLPLVLRRAFVRGAAERQFGGGEAERVGRAALDDRDRLEWLGGRAEEDDGLGISGGRDDLTAASTATTTP